METVRGTQRNRVAIAAVAAALISALVVTVVEARPAEGAKPVATGSASVTKQVKKLKQQLSQLRNEVAALQGKGGGATAQSGPAGGATTPNGPAGGDLTGTYPNPLIGPNAVGINEIGSEAVGASEISDDSVGSVELSVDSVLENEIRYDSVGASELKGVTYAVSTAGTFISPGNAGSATVSCPGGGMVLGGGFAWRDNEASSIIASAPRENDPVRTWDVTGFVPDDAGSDNRLYAWANCLAL